MSFFWGRPPVAESQCNSHFSDIKTCSKISSNCFMIKISCSLVWNNVFHTNSQFQVFRYFVLTFNDLYWICNISTAGDHAKDGGPEVV